MSQNFSSPRFCIWNVRVGAAAQTSFMFQDGPVQRCFPQEISAFSSKNVRHIVMPCDCKASIYGIISVTEMRRAFSMRIHRHLSNAMKMTVRFPIVLPPRILVLRIGAPDFLSALDNLVDKLMPTHGAPQALVISLRQMVFVDAPGLRAVETTIGRLRAHGVKVLLVEASARVKDQLEKCRLLEALGANSYYDNFAAAVAHCYTLNGGVRDRRMRLVDAYAESMLGDSCSYLRGLHALDQPKGQAAGS